MTTRNNSSTIRVREPKEIFDPRRRNLLLLIPSSIFVFIGGSLAVAAYRFLRPQNANSTDAEKLKETWATLGQVSTLTSDEPTLRKALVERRAGWSIERKEQAVYVLPGEERVVVSAVCPHEECDVAWESASREFLCPCHDSRFNAAGARLTGPASRDLTRFASRIDKGVLQIRLTDEENSL